MSVPASSHHASKQYQSSRLITVSLQVGGFMHTWSLAAGACMGWWQLIFKSKTAKPALKVCWSSAVLLAVWFIAEKLIGIDNRCTECEITSHPDVNQWGVQNTAWDGESWFARDHVDQRMKID